MQTIAEMFQNKDIERVYIDKKNLFHEIKVAIKEKSSDIILEYLKNNDSINSSIAQNITGLSPAGVRKIFAKLVEENVILPSGANKNRIYKLNKMEK